MQTPRDYFAAKAMQAVITSKESFEQSKIAAWAYEMADAMIKESKK